MHLLPVLLDTRINRKVSIAGYQYGYGIPGMPGGFNPFLIGPGWLDAAYMTYAWPDYFRSRPAGPAQQPVHPSLVKGM